MKACSVEGCGREHYARGWCKLHYMRWHANGDPGPAEVLRVASYEGVTCDASGCNLQAERTAGDRAYCRLHFDRWKSNGDPLVVQRRVRATCSVDGCDNVVKAWGWCMKHHRRWQKYGDPEIVGQGGQRCRVCHHPARREIEMAVLEGVEFSTIGDAFGLKWVNVAQHSRDHMGVSRVDGPRCKVCDHPERHAIEQAVVDGMSMSAASRKWGVSVWGHMQPSHAVIATRRAALRLAAVRRYVSSQSLT